VDPLRQPAHHRFVITEEADIGVVRRTLARYADRMPAVARGAGPAQLVATELGTNLLWHAKPGGALLTRPVPPAAVEVVAIDHGPGIPDLAAVLAGQVAAPAGLGRGLAAVRRASAVFGVHSSPDAGTVVVSTVDLSGRPARPAPPRRYAAVSTAITAACGDGWAVVDLPGGGLAVAVVDGLGHGAGASEAADAAVAAFAAAPSDVDGYLDRANAAMRATRGGAVTVCRLAAGTVRYLCVGNVNARILAGGTECGLVSYNGTLGLHVEPPRARVLDADLPAGATLVVWTDGLSSRPDLAAWPRLLEQDPGVQAAALYRDWWRERDDATVLVVRP
jgi:anti-sigma regulatory factor (Ser/Thr protein kinase)